jgi:hypothetical protein
MLVWSEKTDVWGRLCLTLKHGKSTIATADWGTHPRLRAVWVKKRVYYGFRGDIDDFKQDVATDWEAWLQKTGLQVIS